MLQAHSEAASTSALQSNRASIRCNGLELAFDQSKVLQGLSLEIEPGECFALLGASGSGKSSFLRIIAGLTQPSGGRIYVNGLDVTDVPPWQRGIGMVFQNYALWPHLNVRDNVAFGLVERRIARSTVETKTFQALEMVGLSGYSTHMPHQLSGGQQQRVALARVMAVEPQVLLLDEPFAHLDKSLRAQLRSELRALQRSVGITTILVTHDQEEAMATADRMAVLAHGVIQQVGAPRTLYDYPANLEVARFIGTMNFLHGKLSYRADGVSPVLRITGVGEVEMPIERGGNLPTSDVTVAFRPHSVRMDVADAFRDPRLLWLSGTVELCDFSGATTRYGVRMGTEYVLVDQAHGAGLSSFCEGSAVALGVSPSHMRLFRE